MCYLIQFLAVLMPAKSLFIAFDCQHTFTYPCRYQIYNIFTQHIVSFRTAYFVLVVLEITNTMHRFALLLYSVCWLLHVSAVVCHHQGASGSELHENTDRFGAGKHNRLNHDTPIHRPLNQHYIIYCTTKSICIFM
jgi:hypothetical protein